MSNIHNGTPASGRVHFRNCEITVLNADSGSICLWLVSVYG